MYLLKVMKIKDVSNVNIDVSDEKKIQQ